MKYMIMILLIASCGGTDLKKVEDLEGFRVLAIMTDTPEVTPGTTVSDLKILFSDIGNGGRDVTVTATGCIDPGISLGAEVDCSHDPDRVIQNFSFNTSTDDQTSGFFTGLTSAIGSFTVPVTILTGRSAREQFNGIAYIIKLDLNIQGTTYSSFRRIIATNRTPLNSNPSGGAMLVNGEIITSSPSKEDTLSLRNASQESYSFLNLDGEIETRKEEYQVAWYVSEGELDKPKSFVSENVEYLSAKDVGNYLQIAVIRDERGGIEFLLFKQ